jgi:hypothetical protein
MSALTCVEVLTFAVAAATVSELFRCWLQKEVRASLFTKLALILAFNCTLGLFAGGLLRLHWHLHD